MADVPSRQERRKARTRQALVDAAKRFLAAPIATEPSILEITHAADVGFGSFYNHFDSKTELFDAALADVMEEYGQFLDRRTADIADPAEVFATSVRLTGRMVETHPQLAGIIVRSGMSLLTSQSGLAPRALRDINRAIETGRFSVQNPFVALASAGGSLIALLHLALSNPGTIDYSACDELAEQLLRMFGMPASSARRIAHLPLHDVATPLVPARSS